MKRLVCSTISLANEKKNHQFGNYLAQEKINNSLTENFLTCDNIKENGRNNKDRE